MKKTNEIFEDYREDLNDFANLVYDFLENTEKLIDFSESQITLSQNKLDNINLFGDERKSIDSIDDLIYLFDTLNLSIKKLNEITKSQNAIIRLYNNDWINCRLLTNEDRSKIDNLFDNNINMEVIEEVIFDRYDNKNLNRLLNEWSKNKFLNKNRFTYLEQALDCYKKGLYAACVALITCQYGGIIKEIEIHLKKYKPFKVQIKAKELKQFQDKLKGIEIINKKIKNNNKKKVRNSEKLTCERILAIGDKDILGLFWNYWCNYVYKSNKKSCLKNIPNRHAICHGAALDYNNKKVALRSILLIDFFLIYSSNFKNIRI
ncbi:hypothetical protein DWZ20_13310 [Clostridium perfringens]|uniref:hypothetical protein n=1 Tax=Clostridium perfringens TaxID=1502 RepID=UPI000E52D3BB|nr:hypothetical protein [Clostridium perfringens]RHN23809.1 hypothetical protein DWZ20_13310 [Clostridium perfringens]